jgi:hypothetical protein
VKAAARDLMASASKAVSHSADPPKLRRLPLSRGSPQTTTMSQKRKRTETTEGVASAPKSFKKHRASKPGQSNEQSKQRPRFNISHDDENGRSTNALKGRIRDLKRLLAHIDNVPKHKMSAGARQERERELQACEHEVAEKIAASREAEYRKKMIGKYHQVRFFGRWKRNLRAVTWY